MITCKSCNQEFQIPEDEKALLQKIVYKFGETKINPAEPTHCPDCRQQIRNAHRNEQELYQNKSAMSGQSMISIYSPNSPWSKDYKIFTSEEWFGDKWDALDYGQDFDSNQNFFDQFKTLQDAVPKIGLIGSNNENSPYMTSSGHCKNCYLINCSENCEDCYYGKLIQYSSNCVDCCYAYHSQYCYECFNIEKCYNSVHLYNSTNSSDCYFSDNLTGCRNCFLCTNLVNKEYHFMNQQLPPEEYKQKLQSYLGSYQNFENLKKTLAELSQNRIHKYASIINSENCTGDFIKNSRNCFDCYDTINCEDCRNVRVGIEVKDCISCNNLYINSQLCYDLLGAIGGTQLCYSSFVFHSDNILYCHQMHNCKDCFACVGLKNKQYCILNKQYTKEQYNELVPKIIENMKQTGEWGLFFPISLSPFGYNETVAQDYYPITKEQAQAKGWQWHESSEKPILESTVEIPDHISQVSDTIINETLACQETHKPYRITIQELKFYRTMQIPIPKLHPSVRHLKRMQLRNPREMHNRNCAKCQSPIQTTYSPDRPETVYCEQCYLETVY